MLRIPWRFSISKRSSSFYFSPEQSSMPLRVGMFHILFTAACMLICGWLFMTPWTVAAQALLSIGFPRQEYGSGLLFPSPGDLPDPRIESTPLESTALAGGFFTTSATWEDLDAGKDWGQEKKGATEDEMVAWNHQLSDHDFEQTAGDSDGQGSLACCSPWGH